MDEQENTSSATTDRPTISGVVTSFNEDHNIAACLESLLWCDEIILVDSFSTDRTPEIAQTFDKVRFFQRKYFGAGAQKNWALQHVQHDWVFLLDADERCTPELRREVEELVARSVVVDQAEGPDLYNGAPKEEGRFFQVGHLSEIDGEANVETGNVGLFTFIEKINRYNDPQLRLKQLV